MTVQYIGVLAKSSFFGVFKLLCRSPIFVLISFFLALTRTSKGKGHRPMLTTKSVARKRDLLPQDVNK